MNPWILATRPRTLPATIGPLLVGNLLAFHLETFSFFIALISTLCAVFLQVSVNLANDYFDYKNGIDTDERLGPKRVTQSGLISPTAVRNAMLGTLFIAIFIGIILVYHSGWPIVILAFFAVFGTLTYSGGPYPLASHGLGEIAAFIYFGLVAVVGSYYIQADHVSISAWLLGASIGLFNAAIMLVNNTRDIATDTKANKNTLAVKIGEEKAKDLYQALVYLPFGLSIGGFLLGSLSGLPVLLSGFVLLKARKLSQEFRLLTGAALNPLLGQTAKLTLFFSLLYSAGILLS